MIETTTRPGGRTTHRSTQGEAEWQLAIRIADEFLRRWDDPLTESQRDDLGAEAAVAAVAGWGRLRDKACFPAFVRTIARRRRALAVRERVRLEAAGMDFDFELRDEFEAPREEGRSYPVAGAWVRQSDLIETLPGVLARLRPINAHLLMGYYEGFSCGELAERFALTLEAVRVRIHRSRQRVRSLFEQQTKNSGDRSATVAAGAPRLDGAAVRRTTA